MRFLIVDASAEFRRTLADLLRACWHDAKVEEWDPAARGSPVAALTQDSYSAVLLELNPAGQDGMAWLREIRSYQGAPPVLLVAHHGDTHAAIHALKAGAADFLRRADLGPARLARALEDAMR